MVGQATPVAGVRRVILVLVGAMAVAYAAMALLYSGGGTLDVTSPQGAGADVAVRLEVVKVQLPDYSALLRFRVTDVDEALLGDDERIAQPLRIAITGSDGTDDFVFPAGTALGRAELTVGISGPQSGYPFDVHEAGLVLDAATVAPGEGDSWTTVTPHALSTDVVGGAPGWDTDAVVEAGPAGESWVKLTFARSFSTQFFAILLVIMAAAIALFSLTVGISLLSGRQPIDSSIVGWGAALLFALLALRFYLPGEPPIGSGIDVFAYMWVTLIAFIGAGMSVVMWLRRRWEDDGLDGASPAAAMAAEDVGAGDTATDGAATDD